MDDLSKEYCQETLQPSNKPNKHERKRQRRHEKHARKQADPNSQKKRPPIVPSEDLYTIDLASLARFSHLFVPGPDAGRYPNSRYEMKFGIYDPPKLPKAMQVGKDRLKLKRLRSTGIYNSSNQVSVKQHGQD